jgi:hypothetical protein
LPLSPSLCLSHSLRESPLPLSLADFLGDYLENKKKKKKL